MGKGAAIFVNYQDNAGAWITVDSGYISGTNDWARYELKFTLPSDAISNLVYARAGIIQEIGTAYFECLQLEEGSIANRYNLVENADLTYGYELPSFWTKNSHCDSNDKSLSIDGKVAFRFNGSSSKNKNISQSIPISGKAGDVFALGGWAKGASAPLTPGASPSRYFALDIGILKTDDTYQWHVTSFNEDTSDWQYVSDRVVADADYKSVTVYGIYYSNANTVYFTNFELYKEEFGYSYTYDSKGNVTSVTDLAKQKSTFEYTNNDLVKAIDPSGGEFNYEYDGKHNITKATSATNVVYSFTYDSSGNPLKAKVGEGALFIESTARYSLSGNYLKSMTDSEGNSIINHYDEAKGILIANTDGKGSKTTYQHDNMDRLLSVSKILGTRNIEIFPLDTNTLGNKGTKPIKDTAIFATDGSGNSAFASYENSLAYYDLGLNKKSGTMSIWFNTNDTTLVFILGNEGSNGEIFNVYLDGQSTLILNCRDTLGNIQNIITVNPPNIIPNQWNFVALRWQLIGDTLNCKLYLNSSAYTGSVQDIKDFTGGITAIGSSIFGKYYSNGLLENFTYAPSALSDNDIIKLYDKTLEDDTGITITNSYTYENDRIETITHNGFSYSFGYDSFGNNETVAVAGQNLITNDYNHITGNLEEYQYGNGQRISLDYDDLNRVIARNFKNTTDQEFNTRYTYQYDNAGNLGYHEDKVNNKNYRYIYDLADRLVKVTDSEGNYTTFGYDKNNNQSKLVHKIDNNSYETYYSHDKDNKPDEVYYGEAVANNIDVEYFPLNGTTVGSKGTVPVTETPVFEKDKNGETVLAAYSGTKVIYNLGISKASGTMAVWFTTEGAGSRLILSNEGTSKLLNVYVDTNQKVNIAVINNAGVFTNVIPTVETITPKEWNFVALKWQLDGSTLTLTFYLNNKPYTANITDFKDFTGAQTAVGSNPNGNYTLNGLIKNFSYSPLALSDNEMLAMYYNNRVNYEYDTLGRLTKKIINAGANSFETSYSYVAGNVTGATTSKLFSISNNGTPIEYEYDANGNITKIIEDGRENLYYYNELNELIQEDIDNLSKSILYNYDLGGNIIGKTEITYGNGEPGTTITYDYDDTWKDKLKSYNGKIITYDEIGNPLTYDGYTYSWEEGRKLKSIIGNGQNISYKYNDVGIRTEKNVDGVITKYYLSGDKVILEDNGIDKLYYSYDSFNNLISMNLNGDEYYYIRNGQGDIIGLFDDSGTEVVKYYYDSWGKLISIEGTLKDTVGVENPYRYRGYRYDNETGLYYLQSRYYNPEWCRFINGDSFLGIHGMLLSHNLFAYCHNNAVNNSDSSGHFFDIFLDLLSMAQSIIDIVKNPTSGKAWAALAADVAFAAVPGLTGGGLMVRAGSKVEKVAEVAKLADKGSDVAKGAAKAKPITNPSRLLEAPKNPQDHHIIPAFRGKSKSYADFIKQRGINVDDYTITVSGGKGGQHMNFIHGKGNWNPRWKEFIDNNPNATAKDIYQFGGKMMDEYNLGGYPIHPYGK